METYDDAWIQIHVAQTIGVWQNIAGRNDPAGRRYDTAEQQVREQAYDEALEAVENDLSLLRNGLTDRAAELFGVFAPKALDLDNEATEILTQEFLPVGTGLAQWARRFDPDLSMADVIQAARNAWTACGLQPLFGAPVSLTPSIFGYSLLYPYSDNYIDDEDISGKAKYQFSRRFRARLAGQSLPALDQREHAIEKLIALIEGEYPRAHFPGVFDCLLAIHQAQEQSIQQLQIPQQCDEKHVLQLSCAKGGSSVLADACLVRGFLTEQESTFAFEWGVLLQLGDDLQDVREDLRRGSSTLFSRAAASGKPLDDLALQLLGFSEKVARRMDALPNGTPALKGLLKMSWRSLILRAIADSHEFFSPGFLEQAEQLSSFRFDFLRKRSQRLASRQGLYAAVFSGVVQDSMQLT